MGNGAQHHEDIDDGEAIGASSLRVCPRVAQVGKAAGSSDGIGGSPAWVRPSSCSFDTSLSPSSASR
jgi:hypothetical protein